MDSEITDTTTYVVQDGDTLAGISIKLGVAASAVKRLNRIIGRDKIYPGQILLLKPPNDCPVCVDSGNSVGLEALRVPTLPLQNDDECSSPTMFDVPLPDHCVDLVVVDSVPSSSDDTTREDIHLSDIVNQSPIILEEPIRCTNILSAEEMGAIFDLVPITLQQDRWLPIYSLLEDGADFDIFYDKAASHQHSLMAVETDTGEKFGGFVSSAWYKSFSFYGGGGSFVYRIGKAGTIDVFPWTGENNYVMYSDDDKVAMGGGGLGGGFAFALDVDFSSGQSSSSSCFANPPLVSTSGTFLVRNIEVWGFESSFQ